MEVFALGDINVHQNKMFYQLFLEQTNFHYFQSWNLLGETEYIFWTAIRAPPHFIVVICIEISGNMIDKYF